MNPQPKLSSAPMPAPAAPPEGEREEYEGVRPPSLPPAAASGRPNRPPLGNLYLLTLLSTVDGSLVVLAAGGHLSSLGGAVAVGLTVIAGAGSWLAARQAFSGRRPGKADLRALALLGLATALATVASAWLGMTLGGAVALHVLPKAAGIALFLVAAEVGGLRVPTLRGVPLAPLAVGAAVLAEVALRWIPS
ncbi:MAG TPA: hypothetical protein VM241_06560 [Candidatus Thermoplasmatota archaeon]|nr:hypothetical protein [Candidatus Thermoplasmatota archaeon]